jgi:hypothetical protein
MRVERTCPNRGYDKPDTPYLPATSLRTTSKHLLNRSRSVGPASTSEVTEAIILAGARAHHKGVDPSAVAKGHHPQHHGVKDRGWGDGQRRACRATQARGCCVECVASRQQELYFLSSVSWYPWPILAHATIVDRTRARSALASRE